MDGRSGSECATVIYVTALPLALGTGGTRAARRFAAKRELALPLPLLDLLPLLVRVRVRVRIRIRVRVRDRVRCPPRGHR